MKNQRNFPDAAIFSFGDVTRSRNTGYKHESGLRRMCGWGVGGALLRCGSLGEQMAGNADARQTGVGPK